MSDYIVKIVAEDPYFQATPKKLNKAVKYLKRHVNCNNIAGEIEKTPQFIDCGGSLERITCPCCGNDIEIAWWGETMDELYKNSFARLDITTPCCGKETTLNDLAYKPNCAFACTVIKIENPIEPLAEDIISNVENKLNSKVKIINAHY